MSGWGTTEIGGEPLSAWEYRSRYLSDGEKHEIFYCPFCNIRLAGCLLYIDGELSKSPHFSAKWGEHEYGCNGEPIEVSESERKKPKAHYIPRTMQVPEALSDRPPPRVTRSSIAIGRAIAPPTEIEVDERRRKAGSLGRAVPKCYVLQPIVEARNIVLKEIYDLAKKEKWGEAKRNEVIKSVLTDMPLKLEDQTNYEDAFHSPRLINRTFPRIYFNHGTVVIHESGFLVIKSAMDGKVNGEAKRFEIEVDPELVDDTSPRWHRSILKELRELAEAKKEFRWYAYGSPESGPDAIVVRIMNLDYLYLKKAVSRPK